MADHVHRLLVCPDCDGDLAYEVGDGWVRCDYCDGRGYYEICAVCREPMGNARRKWKREQAAKATDAHS
jgi:primosomal protein N'